MNKTWQRAASLSFAVVVTGILVARAAGCAQPVVDAGPSKNTAASAPVATSLPADAGPTLGIIAPSVPDFMPATKAAMPLFMPPEPAPQTPPP